MTYNISTETLLQSFTATGAIQNYTIPAGTFRIKIYAWGSGGGNGGGGAQGGGGAFVTGTLRVTPGQILYLVVGQRNNTGSPTLALGAGGGLAGKYYEGGGGGLSGVFLGSSPNKSNCVCIAGGGGCANNSTVAGVPLAGGPGGYPNGFPGNSATGRLGGGGGTQASGGAGASGGSVSALYNGTDLFGGNGSTTATDGGYIGGVGSGGGGWFGGGASTQDGTNAGGGGGSSFIGGLQPPIQTENGGYAPSQTGTASAGGESNRYWSSPLGRSAQNGYIVITRFQ